MDSWLEAAIIAVILLGIGVAIFKGGAANPVSTGGLDYKLSLLDGDVKSIKDKVAGVEERVTEIDRRGATNADIKRLEGRVDGWERKLESIDGRMDTLDREIGIITALEKSNQQAIAAMAESMRSAGESIQLIERKVDATAEITKRVPGFIEKVLEDVARTTAQSVSTKEQVDRLYNFLTEKALK